MDDDAKTEKQRARWRRNKRAARAKAKPLFPPPSATFVARVMAERDHRASAKARNWLHGHPVVGFWVKRHLWTNMHHGRWTSFVADVWAATTLLEKQYGVREATPTRIAGWLAANGRGYDYSLGSLRAMAKRALGLIAALEVACRYDLRGETYWLLFDPDVLEQTELGQSSLPLPEAFQAT